MLAGFCHVSPFLGLPPRKSAFIGSPRCNVPRRSRRCSSIRVLASIPPIPTAPLVHLADVSEANFNSLVATAFVFLLSFWGMISLIKGSVKDRITQASFTSKLPPAELAKVTSKYLIERAFAFKPERDSRKGVMTFEGTVRPSVSIAAVLVSVAASGLWSAGLILNLVLPEGLRSPWWQWLCLASVALIPWYWKKATRKEEIRLMVEQGEMENILYVKGHRDEIISLEQGLSLRRRAPEDA